ncbi:cell division protein ZapE [uncultured Abyssibacter sp.]|uniref:cell division protein ZapE n=1 Tax=uncultured Abyssibacter sp. TaxID=2320202 RepID=UPI0032B15D52
MSDGPRARYDAALATGDFEPDAAQARAVDVLERVYRELLAYPPKSGFALRWLPTRMTRWPPVRGAYLWGGVGRGKTWLMDAFFADLPFERKRRTHFHRFMRDVHQRRTRYADRSDPLEPIAEDLAQSARVLCFDEFYVSDIADAMILGRLTEALFERGVTLVATSNCAPDMLYRNGLQRARFLPAIERIQRHCDIVAVDGATDYRLRDLEQLTFYVTGDDLATVRTLFKRVEPDAVSQPELDINDRRLRAEAAGDGAAWFTFDTLCTGPRGSDDYIELAHLYQWLVLTGVPQLTRELENETRRFINLVDECYDRRVKLVIQADAPVESLYVGERLRFEFQRTYSRLTEMQTRDYLELPHLG